MTPHQKIRWGVLGYARIARESVIPAILRSTNSEFSAIASRDAGKLEECRARYPMARAFLGYAELLKDPAIDAVYIPLPNSLHCEWTIKAAEHGKHVLCEKPLALNAKEAREMAAACAAQGVRLMEAFMYRYTDRTRQVSAVLRSGVLGEIKQISATFRYPMVNAASIKLRPALGGGSFYDVGCYPLNFIGMVADEAAGTLVRPESVCVQSEWSGGIDVNFSALLKYPSGLLAAAHSGFNAHKRIHAEITGTLGVLGVPDTFFDHAGALTLTRGEEQQEIPVAASDRYRGEIEDFAQAILAQNAPRLRLEESIRNLDVMDRLLAAARCPSP